jgi:GDP-L-fucose synthase
MINLLESKILLTGGMGFVGKHVVAGLLKRGVKEEQIIIPRKETDDLMDRLVCDRLVKDIDVIINLAGNVGGIGYNREFPGKLFYDNLMMGVNLIESARIQNTVKKFVQIGTICSYPKFTPVPFKEDDLWNGYPEETNAPYGIAKKALLVMLQSYKQQYNFPGIFLLPVNMYGPGDNFDPNSSHVIPALIKKIHDAKTNNLPSIEVWGDGSATREFFYADDAAEAIILAAEKYDKSDPVNIGAGMEISIKDLVQKLASIMDYKGELVWDSSKPNGQPRRMLDTTRARDEFGFTAKTSFDEGLKTTIDWYENEYLKNNN